jgi:hypothetical protein
MRTKCLEREKNHVVSHTIVPAPASNNARSTKQKQKQVHTNADEQYFPRDETASFFFPAQLRLVHGHGGRVDSSPEPGNDSAND